MATPVLRPRHARSGAKLSRNRHARKQISYKEKSSENDNDDQPTSEEEYDPRPSHPHRQSSRPAMQPPRPKISTKRKMPGPRPFDSLKRTKTIHRVPNDMKQQEEALIQFTGRPMPWQTLPYHLWISIFDYASRPFINDMFQPLPSITWLLGVALCCKAFTEPALSVLYYTPPLSPPARAHRLLERLSTQTAYPTYNYNAKIKYIELEASSTLLHKHAGQDPIDLGAFIACTPQLRGISIRLLSDNPRLRKGWYPSSVPINGRGIYEQTLFAALEEHKVALRDWTWNQSLGRPISTLSELKDIHETAPFRTLRNVTFINYLGSSNHKATSRESTLAEALSLLPDLRALSFKMCSIVNDRLMHLLPDNLQTLTIFDCGSLKAAGLNDFLCAKGANLRQLILDHNNSLNLSFLAGLDSKCPKLEHFKMDLVYFNSYATVRDSDPRYKVLFEESERPSWPTSLRTLELYHLRKWSLRVAWIFFSSLIDNANSLPHLRQLRIKASLEASGWRDRVEFRNVTTQKLRHVFLRRSPPPNPHFRSKSAFNAFKKTQGSNRKGRAGTTPSVWSPNKEQWKVRTSHLHLSSSENGEEEDRDSLLPLIKTRRISPTASDSDPPLTKLRRSTRSNLHRKSMSTLSDGSPNSAKPSCRRRRRKASRASSSEDSALDEDVIELGYPRRSNNDNGLYVQGMCDIVDILIDNQRPAGEQLKEQDFMDDEVSGDEDWNGDDDMPGEGGYAW